MSEEEARLVFEKELACIDNKNCGVNCETCELCTDVSETTGAYKIAIKALGGEV